MAITVHCLMTLSIVLCSFYFSLVEYEQYAKVLAFSPFFSKSRMGLQVQLQLLEECHRSLFSQPLLVCSEKTLYSTSFYVYSNHFHRSMYDNDFFPIFFKISHKCPSGRFCKSCLSRYCCWFGMDQSMLIAPTICLFLPFRYT